MQEPIILIWRFQPFFPLEMFRIWGFFPQKIVCRSRSIVDRRAWYGVFQSRHLSNTVATSPHLILYLAQSTLDDGEYLCDTVLASRHCTVYRPRLTLSTDGARTWLWRPWVLPACSLKSASGKGGGRIKCACTRRLPTFWARPSNFLSLPLAICSIQFNTWVASILVACL
jgi:hypothetical protein